MVLAVLDFFLHMVRLYTKATPLLYMPTMFIQNLLAVSAFLLEDMALLIFREASVTTSAEHITLSQFMTPHLNKEALMNPLVVIILSVIAGVLGFF